MHHYKFILFIDPQLHHSKKFNLYISHHFTINKFNYMTKLVIGDRNKLIENYSLEKLRFINPDESQIWTAKHIVLKKNFTLRRVKYCGKTPGIQKTPASYQEEWNYQNMVRQANLLERLDTEQSPTCHKMIKTSNNIYLVYDEFLPITLKEFVAKNPPNRQKKLELMSSIVKTLKGIHSASIIMLLLSWQNIYPKDNKAIFFGDWSLACTNESSHKIDQVFLSSRSEFLAPELANEGRGMTSSDIYSLGKIFNKIQRDGLLEYSSKTDRKLLSMVNSMISNQPSKRHQFTEIIKMIQNCDIQPHNTICLNPQKKISIEKISLSQDKTYSQYFPRQRQVNYLGQIF